MFEILLQKVSFVEWNANVKTNILFRFKHFCIPLNINVNYQTNGFNFQDILIQVSTLNLQNKHTLSIRPKFS